MAKKNTKVVDSHAGHDHKELELANKASLTRLKGAMGHLNSVVQMVEDKRDCAEVLQQLSAVISALGAARVSLLQGHINSCLKSSLKPGNENLAKELDIIIQRGMKI